MTKLLQGAANIGGKVLAAALAPLGPVRDAKPLHPDGEVRNARLEVTEPEPALGVQAFAERGSSDCLVRISRATGLPESLPDIHGLALRLRPEAPRGSREDLLFAGTGSGRVTRFVLVPRMRYEDGVLTTLLPMASRSGPVLFAARPHGDDRFELAWARPSGAWTALGNLVLGAPLGDPELRFDPITEPVAGLSNYAWVTRLREPAYAWARRLWPR